MAPDVLENHAQKLGFVSKNVAYGELILKKSYKLPIFTQGTPCITLTKIYDLFWDSFKLDQILGLKKSARLNGDIILWTS